MNDELTYTITLNRYQRDNLLWLLHLCGTNGIKPFTFANTGDWLCEIAWMLANDDERARCSSITLQPGINESDRPNVNTADFEKYVNHWLLKIGTMR